VKTTFKQSNTKINATTKKHKEMFRKRKQWHKCNKMKKHWDKQNNKQRNIEKKEKLCKSNVIINKPGQQAKTQKWMRGKKKKSKIFVKKCIEKCSYI
jgi:hypothetical protein